MSDLAVLIAATELQPLLTPRLWEEGLECLTFTEAEALPALQAITSRRPGLVVLERSFAATPRGRALINRIKADSSLAHVTIREQAVDDEGTSEPADAPPTPTETLPTPPAELDFSGTRRAPRYAIAGSMEILVDGKPGSLVNLSLVGAQLVTNASLKPHQRVRVSLSDTEGTLRCVATVVWASFEMPKDSGPRYRVGLDFINSNPAALESYIGRHRRRE